MENELTDFLRRIPWANRTLLENFFGVGSFDKMLAQNSPCIESITHTDGKTYYSLSPGNYHLLPGIPRREMVREYMAENFGYVIFNTAESPCKNADLRVYLEDQDVWVRVWGDMGHVSPESLQMFRIPPVFGNGLLDIILTCQSRERVSFLRTLAESRWENAQQNSVEIAEIRNGAGKSVRPYLDLRLDMDYYLPDLEKYPKFSTDQVPACNDTRKRQISIQEVRSSRTGLLSAGLSAGTYDLLRFIACNPFFRKEEIGILFGGDSCNAGDYEACEKEWKRMMGIIGDVDRLENMGLLKCIIKGPMKETYIPTWQAVDLLAAFHGTLPVWLNRYSQWPLRNFEKKDFDDFRSYMDEDHPYFDSHCFYLQKWGETRHEHQELCRQFGAALVLGARSLKSEYGVGIEVSGMTTISSNLKISTISRGKQIIRQLHPDGCCTISRTTGYKTRKWKVFFEIERNTNGKKDLLGKLEKYRKFIPAARQFYKGYEDVILIFFFDDSGAGQGTILDKCGMLLETMKRYGITGCTGLLSDARNIPEGWLPKHGDSEENACGHMYLYGRHMWLTTDSWPKRAKGPLPGIFTVL